MYVVEFKRLLTSFELTNRVGSYFAGQMITGTSLVKGHGHAIGLKRGRQVTFAGVGQAKYIEQRL